MHQESSLVLLVLLFASFVICAVSIVTVTVITITISHLFSGQTSANTTPHEIMYET